MPQDPRLTGFAKAMRQNPTYGEREVWKSLRNRRLLGEKFRRQAPVGPFIVDFLCERLKLVVELDGDIHVGHETKDQDRQLWLESEGYTILRLGSVVPVEHGFEPSYFIGQTIRRLRGEELCE